MDPRLDRIAEDLARDSHSGASEMLVKIASSILDLSDGDIDVVPESDWIAFGIRLHEAKPTIATIFNLANNIMLEAEKGAGSSRRILAMVASMMEGERCSVERIAEAAGSIIEAGRVVTSSYSSTVSAALASVAARRPLKVTVAESLPGGEGRLFAKKLTDMGIEAEIVPDSNIYAIMAEMDCALTGADSVSPHGLVNKVGTRALVEAARSYGLPAYTVCGLSKFSPVTLSDMVVAQIGSTEGPSERSQMFESTPLDRVTCIITEDGALSPSDIKERFHGRTMASGWSSIDL